MDRNIYKPEQIITKLQEDSKWTIISPFHVLLSMHRHP